MSLVSGVCPDPLENPGQEMEERRIDGGREMASGLDPKDF